MGYSGITGPSGKMLANLNQYGLIEKAGKGGVRVTALAVDIMHPDSEATKRPALEIAAFNPPLFADLRSKFPDGVPSSNALESYLMRQGFADAAVKPAVSSYMETCRFIQQEGAYESYDATASPPVESPNSDEFGGETDVEAMPVSDNPSIRARAPEIDPDERVVFVEEGGVGQRLKLMATGDISDDLLEALEDYVKRQRKRLQRDGS